MPSFNNFRINQSLIKQILSLYDLAYAQLLPPEKGYRNKIIPFVPTKIPAVVSTLPLVLQTKKLALILFKNEPQIVARVKNAQRISRFLAKQGFPVRLPLTQSQQIFTASPKTLVKISAVNSSSDNPCSRYAAIYTYLPGKTIGWESYTQKHIKLLGKTLSNLHASLQFLPTKAADKLPNQIQDLQQLLTKMQRYFAKTDVSRALEKKLKLKTNPKIWSLFRQLLSQLKPLPSQALHLDFVRSNILFSQQSTAGLKPDQKNDLKNETDSNSPHSCSPQSQPQLQINNCPLTISGLLDFEKVGFGPVVIDIARTLAFLIVDCKYKSERQIRKYFLHSGYRKRGTNPLPNLNLLNPLLLFFLVFDFYKLLLHNPYENLLQNQHFVRTQDYLLQHKALITN